MALKDAHVMRPDSMQFVKNADKKGNERLEVRYYDADGQALREWYYLRTPSDRKAFYYNFMRMHLRIPERQIDVESPDDALAYEHLFRVPLFVIARKKEYYWQIREKIFDLALVILAVIVLASTSSFASPAYDLSANVSVDAANNAASFKGQFLVKDWPADVDGRRCLFLPYNDTDYEFDPIRDFDLVPRRFAKPQRRRGRQTVQVTTQGITQKALSPQVIELIGAPGDVALAFEGAMPRWPDANRNEYVLADFHPQPLASCPAQPAESRTFTAIPAAKITAKLSTPEGWYAASPAVDGRFEGRKLVVAILRGFDRETIDVGGLSVEVFSRSKDFRNLMATMGHALRVGKEIFGPLPFQRLVVLETSDVEKSSLPGVVVINRPHQAGMSELQGEILNWTDWQATSIVAEQWFGASATVATLDDLWLLRGFVDFATIEALASFEHRYSLFRHDGSPADDQINFDYRQNQDLLAAALTYLQPYNALTTPNLESLHPFAQQNSLSYVRHALALRQINWTLGRAEFRTLLRRFFAEARGKAVRPRDFGAFLKTHAPAAATYLKQWWATAEWPDFELLGVDEEPAPDGKGRDVTVTLSQHGGYALPVTVAVKDEADLRQETIAQPIPTEPGRWQAKIRTSAPVARVEIDPKRQVFDWDRFDNRDAWPAVRWLPGNARTLSDDAYTVIWLPLASALPGDPLTLQLVGQAFRYMHSSTTAILSYQPKTKVVGYSLYYLTDFPQLGGYMVADALQDKGLAFRGERAQAVGVYKTVSLIKDPYLEYGVRVRNREALGDPMTRHQTAAFKASATPLNQYDACRYNAKTELEHTVHARQEAQDYARNFLLADLTCKMGPWLEGTVRGFGGELTRDRHDFQGGNYRFHPQDASEARMRFDDPQLERADRIGTVGADLLVPMPLPIADAFYVLKRETRFRVFYDYGRSEHPNATYRDAGVGLWAPLGFDLVGKSSVALLNFSLLVVLYREAGDYRSRKPGVLFDFDFFGKL